MMHTAGPAEDGEGLRSELGLTLLEVLLAVAILGTISALLAVSFAGTIRVLDGADRAGNTRHAARAVLHLLVQELRAARHSAVFPWMGRSRIGSDGEPSDLLAFVSTGAAGTGTEPLRGGLSRLVYVREGSRLLRYSMSNLNAVEASAIRPAEVGTGVLGFNLRYYDGRLRQWMDDWNGGTQGAIPAAVRIDLTLETDSRGRETYTEWATLSSLGAASSRPPGSPGEHTGDR